MSITYSNPELHKQILIALARICAPLNAPQKAETQQEDGCGRFAHGVERQSDKGQGKIGQADIQASSGTVWHNCTNKR
jgi:hypothetical protein